MKNRSVFWTLFLTIILLVTFQSCDDETNELVPSIVDTPSKLILSNSKHTTTFFSNEYTSELLSGFNDNFQNHTSSIELPEDQVYNSEVLMKKQMMSMDTHFQNLYVSTIIPRGGYPLWEAGWMIHSGEDASFYAVPILKADSEEIEGLISLAKFNDSNGNTLEKAYSLTYRSDLNESDPEISNKEFYQEWFSFYDDFLFSTDAASQRDEVFPIGFPSIEYFYNKEECTAGIGLIGPPSIFYEVCTCTENLTRLAPFSLNYSVVNTDEERVWVNAHCDYAHAIDVLMGNHFMIEVGQVFLDIGMANEFGIGEFRGLVGAVDVFMDDPENQQNIATLYNYFATNGLNPFAISGFDVDDDQNLPPLNTVPIGDWIPMNAQDYKDLTSSIQDELYAEWVGDPKAGRIYSLWNCRVLGPAHEIAVLNSLGLAQNNQAPSGFSRKPDGYYRRIAYRIDGVILGYSPAFIEVKGAFSSDIFDYTDQQGQFADYLGYLSNPSNTIFPATTMRHGLHMIVPANVSLDEDVITAASNVNVPLYLSKVEHRQSNLQQIRVTWPELQNLDDLNLTGYLFSGFGRAWHGIVHEAIIRAELDFTETTIDFVSKIEEFEQSYLLGNFDPICDPDD